MARSLLCCTLAVLAPRCADALVCRDAGTLTRRGLLQRTVAAGVTLGAAPVWADTQPILSEQSSASLVNEEKRAKFVEAQKAYKKKWRKELANLEYATSDLETVEAIEALAKVCLKSGGLECGRSRGLGFGLGLAMDFAAGLVSA